MRSPRFRSFDSSPAASAGGAATAGAPISPTWEAADGWPSPGVSEDAWRELRQLFAFHPLVVVGTETEAADRSSTAAQIDFRVRTVVVNDRSGQLDVVDRVAVRLVVPATFPRQSPQVQPLSGIFHPNVSFDAIHGQLWHDADRLTDLVQRVAELLAYRSYDPASVVNENALQWMRSGMVLFPTDNTGDFSPSVAGGPRARILQAAPAALDEVGRALAAVEATLIAAPPHSAIASDAAVRAARAGDQAMSLLQLLELAEPPPSLRDRAAAVGVAARSVLAAVSSDAASLHARSLVTRAEAGRLALDGVQARLASALRSLGGLVAVGEPDSPAAALAIIPPLPELQSLQLSLPRMLNEARRHLSEGERIESAIGVSVEEFGRRAQGEYSPTALATRAATAIEQSLQSASRELTAAMNRIGAVVAQASAEVVALDVIARWREFVELSHRAEQIEGRIRELGAAGLEACYVETAGGTYGPFGFEQPVELSTTWVAVRPAGDRLLEVSSAVTCEVLASGASDGVRMEIPASDSRGGADAAADGEVASGGARVQARFVSTERCAELAVMLEYLRRNALETVQAFTAYDGEAESWVGKLCRLLSQQQWRNQLQGELARDARRWRHTVIDLASLGAFKQRLATYFVLVRAVEQLPGRIATIVRELRSRKEASAQLTEILSRSSPDAVTGQPVIPTRLASRYREAERQEQASAQALRITSRHAKRLRRLVVGRLSRPQLLGVGSPLSLQAIPALPPALASLPLDDASLARLIKRLEGLLGMKLGGPRVAASPSPTAAVAPGPAGASTASDAALGGNAPVDGTVTSQSDEQDLRSPGEDDRLSLLQQPTLAEGSSDTWYVDADDVSEGDESDVATDLVFGFEEMHQQFPESPPGSQPEGPVGPPALDAPRPGEPGNSTANP